VLIVPENVTFALVGGSWKTRAASTGVVVALNEIVDGVTLIGDVVLAMLRTPPSTPAPTFVVDAWKK
jgi:hypothetical protein